MGYSQPIGWNSGFGWGGGIKPPSQLAAFDITAGNWTTSATASNSNRTMTNILGAQLTRVLNVSLDPTAKTFWQWYINTTSTQDVFGMSSGSTDAAIGNFGGPSNSSGIDFMGRMEGAFISNGSTTTNSTGFTTGQTWDCAYDGPNSKYWMSPDGTTWYGSGTSAPINPVGNHNGADNTGGPLLPAASGWAGGLVVTIIAGGLITRAPPTGFTVLP